MLHGRDRELEELERLYDAQKFENVLVYGTRYVGKSSLLHKFVSERDAICFTALETSPAENLERLSKRINEHISAGREDSYASYREALEEIAEAARQRRIALVIDDYQFLAASYKGMNALLRYFIEERLGDSRLMLVLCVSSMQFASHEFFGEKGDFSGLTVHTMRIEPLDFFETRDMLSGFSPRDAAVIYAITGGIPSYLRRMNGLVSLRENIISAVLSPDSSMLREPQAMLRRETREPVFYNGILSAIASGCTKNTAISSRVQLQTSACTAYLNNLIALGIVRRERPAADTSRKKTVYAISDGFLRFWYTFLPKHMDNICRGEGNLVWDAILPELDAFMRQTFRDICTQWLRRENEAGRLPVGFTDMGSWWGGAERVRRKVNEIDNLRQWLMRERSVRSLPLNTEGIGRWWSGSQSRRGDDEIDIVAPADEDQAIFAQCKWSDSPVKMEMLTGLAELCESFDFFTKHLFLFSLSGFTQECSQEAARRGNVMLISYDHIFSS